MYASAPAAIAASKKPCALPAPEEAVVDKDRVGFRNNRRFDQRAAGRHTGDDATHFALAFDLQSVRAVILETLRLQQRVERLQELLSARHFSIVRHWVIPA